MPFTRFGLDPVILNNVRKLGFENPTPIQEQAIPLINEGRNLMGLAQTGTGKTAAFGLPIIQRLIKERSRHVRALIIAPTRELAEQIVSAIREYSIDTDLRVASLYGGVRIDSQLRKLKQGVDIVVGCPGRLVDHIKRRSLSLDHILYLVLDEADQMLDMGFMPDVRRIISSTPKKKQTLLFSATMPAEIRGLAEDILENPATVAVSDGGMTKTVAHTLFPVSPDQKLDLLQKILKETSRDSTIIFARTKQRTKRLATQLTEAGLDVTSLQGNLSPARRSKAIAGFRAGEFKILVATDIASRGLDISSVSHVINYDMPSTVEGYTHRIGRTGRAATEGDAYTLICREDERLVRAIEKRLGQTIPRKMVEGFAADTGAENNSRGRQSRPERRSNFSDSRRNDRGPRSDRDERRQPRSNHTQEGRSSSPRGRDDRGSFGGRGPRRENPGFGGRSQERGRNGDGAFGNRGRNPDQQPESNAGNWAAGSAPRNEGRDLGRAEFGRAPNESRQPRRNWDSPRSRDGAAPQRRDDRSNSDRPYAARGGHSHGSRPAYGRSEQNSGERQSRQDPSSDNRRSEMGNSDRPSRGRSFPKRRFGGRGGGFRGNSR